ncbi:MAG TPA: hypothetical protein VMG31_09730 [Verrucomicrobiae bacterium]|nr:hypothetical protein [Verrucomicrobiae bacterium]
MRTACTLALVTLCVIVAVAPCCAVDGAEDDRSKFDVKIPFEFIVGSHVMPAGRYRLERVLGSDSDSDILLIRGLEKRDYQAITANVVASADVQAPSRLVFHRYGNRAFLSELWIRGKRTGLRLRVSPMETDAAREQPKPEEVTVTLGHEITLAAAKAEFIC